MPTGNPAAALSRLARLLDGCDAQWVVGGSTGLALRGAKLDRAPRDLDLYADRGAVAELHRRLAAYATDRPADDETDRYRSVLSHYELDGTTVELVGDFRIEARDSSYATEVEEALIPRADAATVDGRHVKLIPLGHELIFNLLRDRMDRASVIGEMIAADAERHVPILRELIARNRLSDEVVRQALRIATGEREERA